MSTTKTRTKTNVASKPEDMAPHAQTREQPSGAAEPHAEHHWLEKLVGEWTCEGEGIMEPGAAPVAWQGTESIRSLGGLWIVAEGRGDMPGCGPATTVMTLGHDPKKERFVGTFVASMMTHMWLYEGKLDATEKVLTLNTEGPSMSAEGKMAKYKDVIEIESDSQRTLSSHVLGDDGQWHKFMTANYSRQK